MTRPFQYSQLPFNHQIITLAPQDIGPFIWPQNTWISSSAPRSIRQSRSCFQAIVPKPTTYTSHYIPERSVIEQALQMTGTYHPPPVSDARPTSERRSWSPRPRTVGSSCRSPSINSVGMIDSPSVSTPRDLSEVPVAIYEEEQATMNMFGNNFSTEDKPDMSCWISSPSPMLKSISVHKFGEPSNVPVAIKPKPMKKKVDKSNPPLRRSSARLSKVKADVVGINEPEPVRQQCPEPGLQTITAEACFGGTSECSDSDTDGQNESNTSLNIDLELPTETVVNRSQRSSRAAAKTANELIEAALGRGSTTSPERELDGQVETTTKGRQGSSTVPESLPDLSDTDFPSPDDLPFAHIYKDGAKRPKVQKLPNPVPNLHLYKSARGRPVPSDPSQIKSKTVHVCPIPSCGACFARREHVKRHVRGLHTEEKPYKCLSDGCGKSFSRRDNLGLHYSNLHKMSKAKMQEMLGLLDTVLPATI